MRPVRRTVKLRRMQLHYLKMHGTGNRILVVDQRQATVAPPDTELVRRMGDPVSGPGFDQLMWLEPATSDEALAAYRVFNNDGSEVEQCGNGLRCVARALVDESGGKTMKFDSPAGRVEARLLTDGRVTVNMGQPVFEPGEIPFLAGQRQHRYPIAVETETLEAAVLSMGNPHCVIDVADVQIAPVARLGPALERHPSFPQGANVGFRRIRSAEVIDLRVFERGVGETLACGTGACAAVVSGLLESRLEGSVEVRLPGGELVVSWRGPGHPVWLTGNAEIISEGIFEL